MSERLTIGELRAAARTEGVGATLHAQLEDLKRKEGSNAKPYWELRLRDASDGLTLRVWSDSANFRVCEGLAVGAGVSVVGEFYVNGSFGLDARRWELAELSPDDRAALFAGSDEERMAVERDYLFIRETIARLGDARLRALGLRFFDAFGVRFARAAAARVNHHARRGGLVQHTAQMLRSALAICEAYPSLNRDLLAAGVLFHDCGKLWETCPPEEGFSIERELRGELMGHISVGVEVVNSLWRELPREGWDGLAPESELVRLHLIHLVLSHHGTLEFGSPVAPKTPEAVALHYVDNLDAKLEMFLQGYETGSEVAPGIFDRVRALGVGPVARLPSVSRE